jgi:hypothetical protein
MYSDTTMRRADKMRRKAMFAPAVLLIVSTALPSANAATTKPAKPKVSAKPRQVSDPVVRPLTDSRFEWRVSTTGIAIGLSTNHYDSTIPTDPSECTFAVNTLSGVTYWRFEPGVDRPRQIVDLSYFVPGRSGEYSDSCRLQVEFDRTGATRIRNNVDSNTRTIFVDSKGRLEGFRVESSEAGRPGRAITPYSSVRNPISWFPLDQTYLAEVPDGYRLSGEFSADGMLMIASDGLNVKTPGIALYKGGALIREMIFPELLDERKNSGGVTYNRYEIRGIIRENRLLVQDYDGFTGPWDTDNRKFVQLRGVPSGTQCSLLADPRHEILLCDENRRWSHYIVDDTYRGRVPNAQAAAISPYYVFENVKPNAEIANARYPVKVARFDDFLARTARK